MNLLALIPPLIIPQSHGVGTEMTPSELFLIGGLTCFAIVFALAVVGYIAWQLITDPDGKNQ